MSQLVSSSGRAIAYSAAFVLGCIAGVAHAAMKIAPRTLADCSGVPGAVVHDDGTYEIAYGGYWEDVSSMRFVDRFTPSFYPATYSTVCVSISKQEVGGT